MDQKIEIPHMHTLYVIASMFFELLVYCFLYLYLIAFAIVAQHSYYLHCNYPSCIKKALKLYFKSPIPRNVSQEIVNKFGNLASPIPTIIDKESDYQENIIKPFLEILKNNSMPVI